MCSHGVVMSVRVAERAAATYIDFQERISNAKTAKERIALRNALIDHPLAGKVYALFSPTSHLEAPAYGADAPERSKQTT